MSNDITETETKENVPAWMRSKSTGASIGNLSASDIKPPEIKLLQATSPEAAEQPGARAGEFWLTGQNINPGPEDHRHADHPQAQFRPLEPDPVARLQGAAGDGVGRHPLGHPGSGFRDPLPQQPDALHLEDQAHGCGVRPGQVRLIAPRGSPLDASGIRDLSDSLGVPVVRWTPATGHIITNSRTGIKPVRELFGMMDGRKPLDFYFLRFRILRGAPVRRAQAEYFFKVPSISPPAWSRMRPRETPTRRCTTISQGGGPGSPPIRARKSSARGSDQDLRAGQRGHRRDSILKIRNENL